MKRFISNCLQKQGFYVLPATFIMFIENYCDKQIKHSKIMQSLIGEKVYKQSGTLALYKLYSPVSDLFTYLSHGLNSTL